jgi:hypothetical protein
MCADEEEFGEELCIKQAFSGGGEVAEMILRKKICEVRLRS